jgi:hypothetical protein
MLHCRSHSPRHFYSLPLLKKGQRSHLPWARPAEMISASWLDLRAPQLGVSWVSWPYPTGGSFWGNLETCDQNNLCAISPRKLTVLSVGFASSPMRSQQSSAQHEIELPTAQGSHLGQAWLSCREEALGSLGPKIVIPPNITWYELIWYDINILCYDKFYTFAISIPLYSDFYGCPGFQILFAHLELAEGFNLLQVQAAPSTN